LRGEQPKRFRRIEDARHIAMCKVGGRLGRVSVAGALGRFFSAGARACSGRRAVFVRPLPERGVYARPPAGAAGRNVRRHVRVETDGLGKFSRFELRASEMDNRVSGRLIR
jgi:hypothetical protein